MEDFNFFSFPFLVIKATWWIVTPFIFFALLKKSYLYRIQRNYILKQKWTLLEIRLPQEVLKTPKAMEYVLAGMHGSWDELNWRDIWIKGEVLPSFSLEIVGTEGEVHFYIMTLTKLKEFTRENIYAQYPDAEIVEVDDYTAKLPPDIPNKNWDLWGTDLRLNKENPYPIRRYMEFEEIEEERRLDPIAQIAEVMNGLGRGEHMWIQILIQPATDMLGLKKEADSLVARLMKREVKKETGVLETGVAGLQSELGTLVSQMAGLPAVAEEKKKEPPMFPPEYMLSPGERDVVKAIEEKASKLSYETMIRFMYIARSDVFNKANIPALFGFFRHFSTFNLNGLRPNSKTLPKKTFFLFAKTRTQFRKMRLFIWHKLRSPLPQISPPFLLNVEELASLFHFPGQTVKAPVMPRVQSRKPPPPPGLPVE